MFSAFYKYRLLLKPFIQNIKKSDKELFEELYYKYYDAIYSNIFKFVRNQEFAEDILQDVFVTLWEKRDSLTFDNNIAGWLFVVSHNKSLSFLKKKVRESILFQEFLNEEDYFEENTTEEDIKYKLNIINKAVQQLSTKKKQVYILCKFENKNIDEVASIMQISTESVKDYIKQSNRFIREYILKNYPQSASLILFLIVFS